MFFNFNFLCNYSYISRLRPSRDCSVNVDMRGGFTAYGSVGFRVSGSKVKALGFRAGGL
jgi:hypothetical protein